MNRFESQEPLSTFTENCEDVDEEIPWKYFAHSTWIVFDFVSSVFVALWNAWKSDWGNLNMQMKITMTTSVFFSTFDFLLNYNRNNKLILLRIENKKDENFQWKIAQIKEWNTKFRRQKLLSLKEMEISHRKSRRVRNLKSYKIYFSRDFSYPSRLLLSSIKNSRILLRNFYFVG